MVFNVNCVSYYNFSVKISPAFHFTHLSCLPVCLFILTLSTFVCDVYFNRSYNDRLQKCMTGH